MKIMGFVVEIEDLKLGEEEAEKTSQQLVAEMIKNIMLAYGVQDQGFGIDDRRLYGKICDVLEGYAKTEEILIELEDAHAEFIIKCRSKCKIMPNKLSQRVELLLDGIKDKEKISIDNNGENKEGSHAYG